MTFSKIERIKRRENNIYLHRHIVVVLKFITVKKKAKFISMF